MRPSFLLTDKYKFAMRDAGFPHREETFYYSHRRGGVNGKHFLPVGVEPFIRALLPENWKKEPLKVRALDRWQYFHNREPAFSVTGRSEVVSWLEPTALQLQFMIQAATHSMSCDANDVRYHHFTCWEERDLVLKSLFTHENFGKNVASLLERVERVVPETERYQEAVFARTKELIDLVGADRIFEVGLRACSCPEQHMLALEAMKAAGLMRTSDCYGAQELGLKTVGTMGHEHVMRHGSDLGAFQKMIDLTGVNGCSFLPDTFDTKRLGLPAAFKMAQWWRKLDGERVPFSIRFDSAQGARENYTETVSTLKRIDGRTAMILESGWNLGLTREFEVLRERHNWPAENQHYGFGNYLVAPPWPTFSREDVAAVWKLSQTGDTPVMKWGDESDSGKQSLPGRPVATGLGPFGGVKQEGEDWIPKGDELKADGLLLSPETKRLIATCCRRRKEMLEAADKGD